MATEYSDIEDAFLSFQRAVWENVKSYTDNLLALRNKPNASLGSESKILDDSQIANRRTHVDAEIARVLNHNGLWSAEG